MTIKYGQLSLPSANFPWFVTFSDSIIGTSAMSDMVRWCTEQFGARKFDQWWFGSSSFFFPRQEDYILFRLTWENGYEISS